MQQVMGAWRCASLTQEETPTPPPHLHRHEKKLYQDAKRVIIGLSGGLEPGTSVIA